jgi:hypothetical protein
VLLAEAAGHGGADRGFAIGGHEGHDRAAEPAAGHAGPEGTVVDRGLDGRVGLRPGHPEPVAERTVRRGQQIAHRRLVAGPQQLGDPQDAAVLGDDVLAYAPQGRVGQPGRRPGVGDDVAQRPHAQLGRGRLAGLAAATVLAVAQRLPGAGVDDQQGQAGRGRVERDRFGRAGAAVEQQRVPGLATERGELVHDPGGHAGELVLRPPGQGGQLTSWHRYLVQLGQRERHRALQRGRGRQAGARGQVGVDGHVGAAGQVARLAQRPGHPGRVGGPAGDRAGLERVDVQDDRIAAELL